MGCFQAREDGTGWCGLSGGTIEQNTAGDTKGGPAEEGKTGQKPSEVLEPTRENTNGLFKNYQKVKD